MDKPILLQIETFKRELASLINESGLPVFAVAYALKDIYAEVHSAYQKQLAQDTLEYQKQLAQDTFEYQKQLAQDTLEYQNSQKENTRAVSN